VGAFPRFVGARIEGLLRLLIAVATMALQQAAPAVGQGHGVVTTIDGHAMNQPLISQVSKVGAASVDAGLSPIAEIAFRDDAKGARSGERSALRSAQAIGAIAITHELAFRTARQIQVAHEYVAGIPPGRVVVALASTLSAIVAAVVMRSIPLRIVSIV